MALSHDEIRGLLPAFALGAVPRDEADVIRTHLNGCDECAAEALELGATSDQLALSVTPEPLPAGFVDRVLTRVREEQPVAEKARRRWSLMPALTMAACVLIAASMAYYVVDVRRDNERQQQVVALVNRDLGIALEGEGNVTARVVPNGIASQFAVMGLPEAPEGRTYQLWLMDNGSPVSAGVFEVEDGVALIDVAQPVEDYQGAAVTIERAGGVDAPTTEPILSS